MRVCETSTFLGRPFRARGSRMSARALMVLGTASNVGKSLVVAALCRHFARLGVRVAPFKAQNMSLNSAATPDGLEIGRAQALQAQAAGIAPSADMNPVLLKPTGTLRSQVIVQGRIWGTREAGSYLASVRNELFGYVTESYSRLAAGYELVILEGAGSPAEINLRHGDIVNMEMAHAARARCLLLGDIDRGGVFASLLGTVQLLDERDRERIVAFAINKFRGDRALLQPGIDLIEPRLRLRCAGVIPHLSGLRLDEEDSLSLDERIARKPRWREGSGAQRALRVAVVHLPSLANFTDFDPLDAEPSVDLRFVRDASEARVADLVILPGSKATIADLRWLYGTDLREAIAAAPRIFGICGGMQMLGWSVADPHGVEGGGTIEGLGMLDLWTTLNREKITRRSAVRLAQTAYASAGEGGSAYEIHVGETTYGENAAPFAWIVREGDEHKRRDGAISSNGRVAGSYLHGLFENDAIRHAFIQAARAGAGLVPAADLAMLAAAREHGLDRVADAVAGALDLDMLLEPLAV